MSSRNYALTSVRFVCVSAGKMSLIFGQYLFWVSVSWSLELEKLNDVYYRLSLSILNIFFEYFHVFPGKNPAFLSSDALTDS